VESPQVTSAVFGRLRSWSAKDPDNVGFVLIFNFNFNFRNLVDFFNIWPDLQTLASEIWK
jgi:hypothetical protein